MIAGKKDKKLYKFDGLRCCRTVYYKSPKHKSFLLQLLNPTHLLMQNMACTCMGVLCRLRPFQPNESIDTLRLVGRIAKGFSTKEEGEWKYFNALLLAEE